MRKISWSLIENSIYALGLVGFCLLAVGIGVHMSCNGEIPCPLDRFEHLAYYSGHMCMIFAAVAYCVMPFIKKSSSTR